MASTTPADCVFEWVSSVKDRSKQISNNLDPLEHILKIITVIEILRDEMVADTPTKPENRNLRREICEQIEVIQRSYTNAYLAFLNEEFQRARTICGANREMLDQLQVYLEVYYTDV